MGGLMAGKRGLVMGVANERSIAWGIAKAMADQGAELAFSYQERHLASGWNRLQLRSGPTFCWMWMSQMKHRLMRALTR